MIRTARTVSIGVALALAAAALPALGFIREHNADNRADDSAEAFREAEIADLTAANADTAIRAFAASSDTAFLQPYLDAAGGFDAAVAAASATAQGADARARLAAVRTAFGSWRSGWAEPLRQSQQSARPPAATGDALFNSLESELRSAREALASDLSSADDASSSAYRQRVLFEIIAGVAFLGLGALIVSSGIGHRRARQSLSQAQEELIHQRELAARRGEVLATASHELRNPLTGLVLSSQLLQEMAAEAGLPDLSELAGQVNAGAQRTAQMVVELLDYSRIEAGKLRLNEETVTARGLVDGAIADVRLRHSRADVRVESDATADEHLRGDPARLRMVLRNLLENAVKYGKPPFRIRVAGGLDRVEIHVEDSGPGIPVDERETVFERFRRGSNAGAAEGTGIGLYISRGIVELHEGTLTVGQSPLGGADFIVRLPAPA